MKRLITLICCLTVFLAGPVHGREVPINPITPDIRDKIRESTELVRNVEDSMAEKVNDLETVWKTYTETCGESKDDRGCVEIQNQVKVLYKEVMRSMESNLPRLQQNIEATATQLGRSIKKKMQGKDMRELYEHVSKKGRMPKARGPLSKKLSEFMKMLRNSPTNISLLEVSLQTQADLVSASEILDYLNVEISRQVTMIDTVQDFGMLSPKMASVMRGVGEIFGFDVDFGPAPLEEEPSDPNDWSK